MTEPTPTASPHIDVGPAPHYAGPLSLDVASLERALLAMDRTAVARILCEPGALPGRTPVPLDRVEGLLVPALRSIGDGWEKGSVALAQVYMAALIAEELVVGAEPLRYPIREHAPRIAIAVLEDRHELGKRIVSMTLRAAGYPLLDYGSGLDAAGIVARVAQDQPDYLLISTLMLRSALLIKGVSEGLATLPKRPVLVVGGAPFHFDDYLWRHVGADVLGRSAGDAIAAVQGLLTREAAS